MTIKIDRFQVEVVEGSRLYKSGSASVKDILLNTWIASFDTGNKELNIKLANMVLDEINTGKYDL